MSEAYLGDKEGELLLAHREMKWGITQGILRIKEKGHTYTKGR